MVHSGVVAAVVVAVTVPLLLLWVQSRPPKPKRSLRPRKGSGHKVDDAARSRRLDLHSHDSGDGRCVSSGPSSPSSDGGTPRAASSPPAEVAVCGSPRSPGFRPTFATVSPADSRSPGVGARGTNSPTMRRRGTRSPQTRLRVAVGADGDVGRGAQPSQTTPPVPRHAIRVELDPAATHRRVEHRSTSTSVVVSPPLTPSPLRDGSAPPEPQPDQGLGGSETASSSGHKRQPKSLLLQSAGAKPWQPTPTLDGVSCPSSPVATRSRPGSHSAARRAPAASPAPLVSPLASFHRCSGTPTSASSRGSTGWSPFRRHEAAGGTPLSEHARSTWKTFFRKASTLITATKAMSKKPPLTRAWSRGTLLRHPSWRPASLLPQASALQARLRDPHAVVPVDSAILRGTLKNGMQYYVAPNPYPRDHVVVRLVLRVGSLQEESNERGLTRFLEHMALRGTVDWPHERLAAFVHRASALGESGFDSHTSVQDCWFQLTISTHSKRSLREGLEFLSQLPVSLRCSDEDIQDEIRLYMEEWRSMQGAAKVMSDTYWHTLFKGSRYADRMPMGNLQVLLEADPNTVRDYYRRWYRPDLMSIVIAGDVPSRTSALTLVEELFGSIPKPTVAPSGSGASLLHSTQANVAAAAYAATKLAARSNACAHPSGSGGLEVVDEAMEGLVDVAVEDVDIDEDALSTPSHDGSASANTIPSANTGGDNGDVPDHASVDSEEVHSDDDDEVVVAKLLRAATLPDLSGTRFLELPNVDAASAHVMVEFILPFSARATLAAKRRELASDLFVVSLQRRLQAVQRSRCSHLFNNSILVERDMLLRELLRFTITLQVLGGSESAAQAVEVVLLTLEEVKARGFANHEVLAAKAARSAELQASASSGCRRDSYELTEMCCQHFLHDGSTLLVNPVEDLRHEQCLLSIITGPELASVARQLRLGYGCRVLWQHMAEQGYNLLGTDALKDAVQAVKLRVSSGKLQDGGSEDDNVVARSIVTSARLGHHVPEALKVPPTTAVGTVLWSRTFPRHLSHLTEYRLGNGMTVLTCRVPGVSGDLHMRCVAPGGLNELSVSNVQAAAVCCFAMEMLGLGSLSAQELEESLSGYSLSFQQSIQASERCMDGMCGPEDLEVLLAVLHHSFRNAPLSQTSVDEAIRTMRDAVRHHSISPDFGFLETVGELSQGKRAMERAPSFMRLPSSSVPTLHDVRRVHGAAFENPSEFVVILAGDLPFHGRLHGLLAKYLASIPIPNTRRRPGTDGFALGRATGVGVGAGGRVGAGTGSIAGVHNRTRHKATEVGWWSLAASPGRSIVKPCVAPERWRTAEMSPAQRRVKRTASAAQLSSSGANVRPHTLTHARSAMPGPVDHDSITLRSITPSPAVFPKQTVRRAIRGGIASHAAIYITFPVSLSASSPTAPLFLPSRVACAVLKAQLQAAFAARGVSIDFLSVNLNANVLDLAAARSTIQFVCPPARAGACVQTAIACIRDSEARGFSEADVEAALPSLRDLRVHAAPSALGTPIQSPPRPGRGQHALNVPTPSPALPAVAAASGAAAGVPNLDNMVNRLSSALMWTRMVHAPDAMNVGLSDALRIMLRSHHAHIASTFVTSKTVNNALQRLFPPHRYVAATVLPDVEATAADFQ